jgi:hypothetical protein
MGISNPSAGRRLSPASTRIYASTPPTGSRRRRKERVSPTRTLGRWLELTEEYSEGVLRGAIITLSRKKGVRGYQLVAG